MIAFSCMLVPSLILVLLRNRLLLQKDTLSQSLVDYIVSTILLNGLMVLVLIILFDNKGNLILKLNQSYVFAGKYFALSLALAVSFPIIEKFIKTIYHRESIFSSHKISISREQFLIAATFLIISTVFVYFYSYSTSPWVANYYGGDSAQFQTIGKAWSLGKIPYRDMFDHKGPVIFLINMIGYSLTGASDGVMLIQIFCLSITCWFIYLISQLITDNRYYGIISVILCLILLAYVYGGGNYTEEYCLPFITMSMYFQAKYLCRKNSEIAVQTYHSAGFALVYGISFGVCIMSKATNGISICAGVLVISVILIVNRQWKNLLENAGGFILGMAIVILPFCIYFMQKGLLSEFLYASIGYNFEYSEGMNSWLFGGSVNEATFLNFFNRGFAFYTIFITAVLAWYNKKGYFTLYCVVVGCLEIYLYLSGALFSQYYIISIPQLVLLINEICLMKEGESTEKFVKIMLVFIVCMFCYSRFFDILSGPLGNHNKYKQRSEVYDCLLDEIPDDEKDSFVAWGNNEFKELYLLNDLMPCYKYFVIQPWHASFSESTKTDIYNTFKYGDAKWILVNSDSTAIINDVLDENYAEVDSADKYTLYQKRISD